MRCPADDEIDSVLDRLAPPERDAAVRAHVADCEECLARHGARFELELWGGALAADVAAARGGWWSRSRVAAAAGVLLMAGIAVVAAFDTVDVETIDTVDEVASDAASTTAPPRAARLLEWTLEVGERGPSGARAVRTEWRPGAPERLRIVELALSADGVSLRHERIELTQPMEQVAPTEQENGP